MNNTIQDLIRKLIENTITEQELRELNTLLDDAGNRQEAERIFGERFELPRTLNEGLTEHESAQMIANMLAGSRPSTKTRRFKFLLAATTLIVLALAGVWIYNGKLSDRAGSLQADAGVKTFAGKDYVHLPDGSTAFLNEGGEMRYVLTDSGRIVTLRGEAYFDVAHDASKPFKVVTGKVVTTVLGTAFNVNASEQGRVTITVTRGKVSVSSEKHTFGTITPDEQIAVNTTTDQVVKSNLNVQTAVTWTNAFFILEEVTLDEAARQISERYGVKIRLSNPALKKCRFSSEFSNNESLNDVMNVISATIGAKYVVHANGEVIVSGKGCD